MIHRLIDLTYPAAKWALFKLDAETAHNLVIQSLKVWQCGLGSGSLGPVRNADPAKAGSIRLRDDKIFGLEFAHRVGLAAGLDKNAECLLAWQALGFSFVEVGTVTAQAQAGNPKPRMFRMPKDQALFNRMGFNNHGAQVVANRIQRVRDRGKLYIPIGVNIGKTKVVELADAPADYLSSFKAIQSVADYVVVNVSSPNTPGLRELQGKAHLTQILDGIQSANSSNLPILLKIAPDMTTEAASECAETAVQTGLKGMVLTNTHAETHAGGPGGLSGRPIQNMSTEMLQHIHNDFGGKLSLIGVGGIMDVASARAKMAAGADLIQIYSGFIYKGPSLVQELVKGL